MLALTRASELVLTLIPTKIIFHILSPFSLMLKYSQALEVLGSPQEHIGVNREVSH